MASPLSTVLFYFDPVLFCADVRWQCLLLRLPDTQLPRMAGAPGVAGTGPPPTTQPGMCWVFLMSLLPTHLGCLPQDGGYVDTLNI